MIRLLEKFFSRFRPRSMTTSEWLEGMRALDTQKPVASRLEGKADQRTNWGLKRKPRKPQTQIVVSIQQKRKG